MTAIASFLVDRGRALPLQKDTPSEATAVPYRPLAAAVPHRKFSTFNQAAAGQPGGSPDITSWHAAMAEVSCSLGAHSHLHLSYTLLQKGHGLGSLQDAQRVSV